MTVRVTRTLRIGSPSIRGDLQEPIRGFELHQVFSLELVLHLQPLPLFNAQSDTLPFHRIPRSMEPDISTLHKPDILTLRRHSAKKS